MKTKILLFSLACFSLTSLSAIATDASDESAPVQLPAYVVTESRQNPAEQQIKRNLDALRAVATKPIKLKAALPLPEVKNLHVQTDAKAPAKSVVVAGL